MSHPSPVKNKYENYVNQAREARADVLTMTFAAGSGHPGSSFSSIDLLIWLYNEELRVDPANPDDPDRDRIIFSKGHGSPALYAVLASKGFFDHGELLRLRRTDSLLQGHASDRIPGVEFSSGSLGQGLSFGVGTALSAKLDDRPSRAYVILGDGELQEGQVWEAAMSAAHRDLDNLIAIVEYNGLQNDGRVADTKSLAPLTEKFESFGWFTTTSASSATQRSSSDRTWLRAPPTPRRTPSMRRWKPPWRAIVPGSRW